MAEAQASTLSPPSAPMVQPSPHTNKPVQQPKQKTVSPPPAQGSPHTNNKTGQQPKQKQVTATPIKTKPPQVLNIDWDFIREQEGFETTGYVPKNKDGSAMGHSGVTIATGFDLGSRTVKSLQGLSKGVVKKLTPFLGLKGDAAIKAASQLTVSKQEADEIDKWSKQQTVKDLKKAWKDATGKKWETLPKHKATPIADLVFNHGLEATQSYDFWKQVTSDDWVGGEANLRNFGEANTSLQDRRTRGADYYNKGKPKTSREEFEAAFKAAKQEGRKIFEWPKGSGKKYTTKEA